MPGGADIIIEHLNAKELLARERRPLAAGDDHLAIKTHPRASHITCLLQLNGQPVDGIRLEVESGRSIEPASRYFIVIGAMKAGTTTLFEMLAQHPAMCRTWAELPGVSFSKEINYFSKLYRRSHSALHYDWRFPFDPARHAWTLDVSPGYAKWSASKHVPARIASLGGRTKLAYILREPIARIESHLAHRLHRNGRMPRMDHCIRTSSYAMQLDNFIPYVDRDDILLLDFDRLRRRPAAVLAQICDFLGIDRFACRSSIHNRRDKPFRLSARQRAELAEALRPDVQRLISVYGFEPAEKWLRRRGLSRLGLPAL